jgi:hypothetical protein
MNRALPTLLLLLLSTQAQAEKTYTANELHRMIGNGQYPPEGAESSTSKPMEFAVCRATAEGIISQIKGHYPIQIKVNDSSYYSVKAWTNDGSVTASCSKFTEVLILAQAPYQ